MQRSALARINLSALQHNLSIVKKQARNSKVMCAVKANAYGHGLVQVAKALHEADGFAVAHLAEAVELRKNGVGQAIFVFQGPRNTADIEVFEQNKISAVIHHESQLPLLKNANIAIWLKVNTGMNRLGFQPEDVEAALQAISACRHTKLIGLFTHMADSDFAGQRDTTDKQLLSLQSVNQQDYLLTTANSASLLHWPESQQAWVRPGIMLYGVNPFVDKEISNLGLKPAMTLTAPVIALNRCLKGEKVGYGGTWQAQRDSHIAVIAIGYGDGYSRHAKNGTPVLIGNNEYPLVGRVSMDLITVDITGSKNIHVGDQAVLWGENDDAGKKITLPVEKVAECADTIAYELLCSVYGRVHYNYN